MPQGAYTLSKRESKTFLEDLRKQWSGHSPPITQETVRAMDVPDRGRLYETGFLAVEVKGHLLPSLHDEELLTHFPTITVDAGAVAPVVNGARVMRPGVVAMNSFQEGEVVVVREERHHRAIAVGVALLDSEKAVKESRGPILENLHQVGDPFWKAYTTYFKGKPP